jgi:hypothetical protein
MAEEGVLGDILALVELRPDWLSVLTENFKTKRRALGAADASSWKSLLTEERRLLEGLG